MMMVQSQKVLVIILTVLLLVGAVIGVAWLIGNPYYQQKLDEEKPFFREYAGYAMADTLEDEGLPAVISLSGERDDLGNFYGDVVVKVDGEKVYESLGCEIRDRDGAYSLILTNGWTEDMDYPKPDTLGAFLWADDDWNSIVLVPMGDDRAYSAFVAPAGNHDEAFALYNELRE